MPAPDAPRRAPIVRFLEALGPALGLGLLTAAAALVGFAWLAEEVMEGETARFDQLVRGGVHQLASPRLTETMRLVSALGSPTRLVFLAIALVVGFLAARWLRGAVLLVLTLAGAVLLQVVLKLAYHRPRPDAFFGYPEPRSYSFPSGHALVSFCLLTALAALLSVRVRGAGWRVLIWILALAGALLIGFSRIYLGVHYPSDVIGGYAAGVIWVVTVAAGDRLWQRRPDREEN